MSDIDVMIQALRGLGGSAFAAEVAKEAMPKVLQIVRETAAKGQSPDGTPWRPRKDGAPALAKASTLITARVLGTVIQLEVPYPYSIHHNQEGTKTRPRRQILPEGEVPPEIQRAIEEAAAKVFARRTR